MRDYGAYTSSGKILTIAEVPTYGLFELLQQLKEFPDNYSENEINPGVPVSDYRERVKIELTIRQNGWR